MTYSFRPYYGSGVNSASNDNEYQEHFLGVKAAGAWGWQPQHFHVPSVMKSGSLNLLETSGPHWACYGTALPSLDEGESKCSLNCLSVKAKSYRYPQGRRILKRRIHKTSVGIRTQYPLTREQSVVVLSETSMIKCWRKFLKARQTV